MKKTLSILGLTLIIAACGNNNTTNKNSSDTSTTASASTPAATTIVPSGPDSLGAVLLTKNDCLTCHKIQEKLIGPAYIDVAKKYSPATPAIIDTLANKVINGGSGNWGQVAMSPHPNLSQADAKAMVKYILSLNKN